MTTGKDRSRIRCYWESQPSGCTKPHCPFMHTQVSKDPYIPEAVTPLPASLSGKIIVNPNKLDEFNIGNRTVIATNQPYKPSVKDRLGKKTDYFEDYVDPEEEDLRRGAMKTIDLRKRLKRKLASEEEIDEEDHDSVDEEVKMKSVVVKKPKKDKKEKKKKREKKEKRRKYEDDNDIDDNEASSTLAQRIAAQRGKSSPGSRSKSEERGQDEYLPTSTNRKIKIKSSRKESLNSDKDSVLSVIDDVDALLKTSSVDLKSPKEGEKNSSDYKNDSDVMKELDDLINS